MSSKSNCVALFIDGVSLHATSRTLGFDIDFKRLLKEFEDCGSLLRAFYYTSMIEDQEYSSIRPLTNWLSYNGYTVVTKAVREFTDASGRRKVKGNMDIELAVDAMALANQIDEMVLFSGDGAFRYLVEAIQRRGVRVTVISTKSTQPPVSPTNCGAKPTSSRTSQGFGPSSAAPHQRARLLRETDANLLHWSLRVFRDLSDQQSRH